MHTIYIGVNITKVTNPCMFRAFDLQTLNSYYWYASVNFTMQ
jgi:hypothetical protein